MKSLNFDERELRKAKSVAFYQFTGDGNTPYALVSLYHRLPRTASGRSSTVIAIRAHEVDGRTLAVASLPTQPLQNQKATQWVAAYYHTGAGDGNRTHAISLEG